MMNEKGRTAAIDLIRRIQAYGGGLEDFIALEQATGNPDVRIVFDVLELEGFAPDKLYDLLAGHP